MDPKTVLRIEGLALFAAGTAAYVALGGPLWLFVVLALAPDISMLAYLVGPRAGSGLYNAFHTYVGPIALGAVGIVAGTTPLLWVGLVWAAHIGMDRAVGYGLKYPSGFGHAHLSPEGANTQLGDPNNEPGDPHNDLVVDSGGNTGRHAPDGVDTVPEAVEQIPAGDD